MEDYLANRKAVFAQKPVPLKAVGYVMGSHGASIKGIQDQTNTRIRSPFRDEPPIFEISGLPEAVELAN